LKKFVLTVLFLLAVGGGLYIFEIGPFEQTPATGQQQSRGRDRSATVKAAKVRLADVEEKLTYVGSLTPNALVAVVPKVSGRVEKLMVEVGDKVVEGQLLAELDRAELTEQLREAEASLRVAHANLKGRTHEFKNLKRRRDNAKKLISKDLVAREEVDNLETLVLSAESQVELTKAQMIQMAARRDNARIQLERTEIRSPFGGFVSRRFVDRGALISPNTPLVEVVDIGSVKVRIAVVEADYRKVSPGQSAEVDVDAYPGRRFEGKITRIAPILDPDTRTVQIEIELDNRDGALKPGMFARTAIVVERQEGVLVIPQAAQVKTVRGYAAFKLVKDRSKVKRVPVKPGLINDGWVEVKGDLELGDWVVTLGSSLLRDGQKVKVAGEKKRAGSKRGGKRGGKKGKPSAGKGKA